MDGDGARAGSVADVGVGQDHNTGRVGIIRVSDEAAAQWVQGEGGDHGEAEGAILGVFRVTGR